MFKNFERLYRCLGGVKSLATWSLCGIVVSLAGVHSSALAAKGGTPQASIVLNGADTEVCYTNNTEWTIAKTTDSSSVPNDTTSIDWKVAVTKGDTTPNTIKAVGFMNVTNGGSAGATIGNVVVNLQRRVIVGGKEKWISAAADVMDSTHGNYTSAKIVKAASQEVAPNSINYVTDSGNTAVGIFSETSGSGNISFLDENNNPIFSITPEYTIAPKETVVLYYQATFDNSILQVSSGESVRFEFIVTFGNAGERGGSGAVTSNVDIDGSESLDADEAKVRSVPDRQTVAIPNLTQCNASVLLTDPYVTDPDAEDKNPTTSGDVVLNGFNNGAIGSGISVSGSGTNMYTVTASINGGACGGSITNEATIAGVHQCNDTNANCEVTLIVGYTTVIDPDTGAVTQIPIKKTFACCKDLEASASSTVIVEAGQNCGGGGQELECGQYSTFSQGGFGHDWCKRVPIGHGSFEIVCEQPTSGPSGLLAEKFDAMFPSGLVVGSLSCFKITLTSAQAVGDFLQADGTPGHLTANLVNPTSSSAGVFAGQVVTLAINIALSDGGYTPAICDCDNDPNTPLGTSPKPYGNLVYCNGSGDSLSGLTVREILTVANNALGCGALPSGYTFGSLTQLLDDLRGAFEPSSEVCQVSAWAQEHLTLATSCPTPE